MNIRIAKPAEFYEVRAFYHKLIDMLQNAEYKPAWEKDIYPSNAYLKEAIEKGELWVCEHDGEFAAAMVLNHSCNEGYKDVKWSVSAEHDEVSVIHVLCVLPTYQGKGIAGAMVTKAIELAESSEQRAVRLDVLGGNLPAERLYIKHGFEYVDTIQMFYEDTGWTDFKLFEYVIR